MTAFVKGYIFLIAVFVSSGATAQENAKTPAQQTRESVENHQPARQASGKATEPSSQAAKPKLNERAANGNNSIPPINENKTNVQDTLQPSNAARRDPFRPFTLNVRPNARRRENLSPLERYDLGQLKLVGVIWNSKEPTAMVEDSVGLGYVVKVGTPIGSSDGTVKSIRQSEIIIEEFFVDLYGEKKRREVSMRVSPENVE